MTAVIESEELRKYDRNRLKKLSEESLEIVPSIDEPTDEQKEWVLGKLKRWTK